MNKTTKIVVGVIAIIIIIIGLKFGQKNDAKESLNIGVISSLTGNASYIGESNMRGAEIGKLKAQDEHKDILINLYSEDSALNPQTGIAAYNKLRATNNISGLVTQASNVSMAILPSAIKDNVIYIAASTFANGFSTPNDLVARMTTSAKLEAEPAIKFLEQKNLSKLGLIYMTNEIGVTLKDSLKIAVASSTVKVILEEGYAPDLGDFKTLVLKMKNAGVDSIYVAGLAPHSANILKQMNELKVDVPVLTYRAGEDPVLITGAGDLAEKMTYTTSYDVNSTSPANIEFVNLYKDKYGVEPNGYAAEAYEAVRLIADTYAECGSTIDNLEAQQCAKDYLFAIKNRLSLFGPLSFDSNGDVTYPFFMKTVRDGKFVKLEE